MANVEATCQQRIRTDLRPLAEQHAVAVQHHDDPVCLDLAEDQRTVGVRVDHPVDGHPVLLRDRADLLVDLQRGLGADVELVPRQDRARILLRDLHQSGATCDRFRGQAGALPGGQTREIGIGSHAFDQTIGLSFERGGLGRVTRGAQVRRPGAISDRMANSGNGDEAAILGPREGAVAKAPVDSESVHH